MKNNNYSIEITEPAEADLHQIAKYIAIELLEPKLAMKVLNTIEKAVLSLEEMPFRHPVVNDNRLCQLGIRQVIVDNYIIFYVINEKKKLVTIIRILYRKRDWLNLL
ncbi:type II toxin-antitoxin system RelE/ParE family toxin [Serpentinicella alkaliphila]|uniref:Addiction module RelE/StbE family toxin n=1 Tax=Serpentinicella alkaliphila TaxID=1734049 RepID=A0A4R2SSP4_9FIRM|nr:type II toxin-antitoxin system RelE/ParE family toxin [Serpentinicella alkaliphila]QUH26182.1 type II toxin-antitoxin system RelE/ParE family toxin [Serpentinicella alkaliphila]TCP93339.1 addiction module RelE/StbE family toxin [Serpentinicella alkaliphila]